jgi:uncharacterized protein (DUF4415 family)
MNKREKLVPPSEAGEAAINAGIAADPDTYVPSDEQFARMRPRSERRRAGRPPMENPKEQVSVRYDADILAAFRATGDGWQTRMNDALRTYLSEHAL